MEIISLLENISSKLKLNFLALVSALLLYSFWYLFNIGKYFSFSSVYISLGHVGYLCLLLIPAFLIFEKELLQKIWIFFSGLALLDLIPMIYITNNRSPYEYSFLNSTTLFIIIVLFLISTLYGISSSPNTKNLIVKTRDLLTVLYSSLFFIFIYHGTNILNRDIPNEERSVMINGLEFHHINYGIALLVIVPFLFKYIYYFKSKKSKIFGYIFIGFIYGTVFDEAYYYMLQEVSDDAYFEISIILASLGIMALSLTIWFFILNRRNSNA